MTCKDEPLADFVKTALGEGHSRAKIVAALGDAGWTSEHAEKAVATYADTEFPLPVPRRQPYLSAREAFLYLLLFSALYVSAFQLGHLLFNLIDKMLLDPEMSDFLAQRLDSSIRWSVATLIIFFPAYALLFAKLNRAVQRDSTARDSKIRKWLTYMTLFKAALFLLGDMSSLVYQVLIGDLETRILLKFLVVALIAGSVFGYYLADLKKEEVAISPEKKTPLPRLGASNE